ncbi:hypothetical protein NDU88_004962 [Pleurodeles waltl]|uniref:Uncharacterized protein n=1 Tax=Pleurodeles waltl TaxID=8319 RepID=A0AAV7NMK9_PLEWA|nr:hypothetical protein NDU88_004962 [Pleurodeles waltl]
MVQVTGKRAPAFTAEELEKLVDWVLPLYAKLYGRLEEQVSTHQKKGLWQAIAKDSEPGGLQPAEHPLQEVVGGPEALGQEDQRGPAGEGLPTRKGCPSDPDPSNGPHSGSGLSRFGWALEGSTAATRG